jgi:hypothetical protein
VSALSRNTVGKNVEKSRLSRTTADGSALMRRWEVMKDHVRRTHDGHQLSSVDNTADIVEDRFVFVSLTVLYRDRYSSPEKAADVVVGELGVIAHDLLDVRHGCGPRCEHGIACRGGDVH